MPHGLPRKIRIVFILQAVLASLGILLGAWLVSLVIKHSLVSSALKEEAGYYWQLHEASPVQPPPNTQNIRGYLLESGQSALSLPANLRNLEPGFHELPKDDQLVLVDVRPAGRLYLVFLRSRAEMLAFWFGIVPVLLTLLAVYGASWVTYRASKRLVSPVNWLARRVSRSLPIDMRGFGVAMTSACGAGCGLSTGALGASRSPIPLASAVCLCNRRSSSPRTAGSSWAACC